MPALVRALCSLAVVVAHQSARAQDAVSQREEIRSIYRRFAPNKLGALARLFAKYEGAEQELLDSVREKYGVPADDDRTGAEAHRYCIIGAGPAGVQLGHLFMTAAGEREAGRDYVVFERGTQSASFFSEFPVHRVLNSINRRFTRSDDLEFNLRHDWNSLLGSEDTVGLFTQWSEEYWPPAQKLVEYINAFAEPQVKSGHIRYCHNVKSVQSSPAGAPFRYRLVVAQTCDQDETAADATTAATKSFDCEVLVMANGMQKPRIVEDWIADLNKHNIRYDQLRNVDPRTFTNKSVLVLGEGNAAAETADNLRNFARDMVFVSRYRGAKTLQQTRYVGDTRARRTTYLDANIFKSYEGQTAMGLGSDNLVAVGCSAGPGSGYGGKPAVCIFTVEDDGDRPGAVVLCPIIGALAGIIERTHKAFGKLVYEMPAPRQLAAHAQAARGMFSVANYEAARVLCISMDDIRKKLTDEQMSLLPLLRDTTKYIMAAGMEFQKPFDVVITSLGWEYDRSVFTVGDVLPDLMGDPRRPNQTPYPSLTPEFESTNAPRMFFAGAATHGLDRYRYKASGGFIHGFRFNIRTLFRILETRFEAEASLRWGEWGAQTSTPLFQSRLFDWTPSTARDISLQYSALGLGMHGADFGTNVSAAGTFPLHEKLVERLNNAGGPYEQVGGALSDAIIYDCERHQTWYLEDVPEDVIHMRYKHYGRLVWSYYYGTQDAALRETGLLCGVRSARTAQLGTFIHPVLQYFPAGSDWPMPDLWQGRPNVDHPSVYWRPIRGVSRVHLPDQFVWGDWSDHETLGVLEIFLEHVEVAAAGFCNNAGSGEITRSFDEIEDVQWFMPDFPDRLAQQAGECWKSGVRMPTGAPPEKQRRMQDAAPNRRGMVDEPQEKGQLVSGERINPRSPWNKATSAERAYYFADGGERRSLEAPAEGVQAVGEAGDRNFPSHAAFEADWKELTQLQATKKKKKGRRSRKKKGGGP